MNFNDPIFIWLIVLFTATLGAYAARFLLMRYGTHLVGRTSWRLDDLIIEQIASKIMFWIPLLVVLLATDDVLDLMNAKDPVPFYVKRTIIAIFILSITHSIVQITSSMLSFRNAENTTTSSILRNIAKVLLYVIALLLVIQSFGVQVYPLVATLGIGGLAVALALQPTLSNLFAGLQIIAARKIEIGDLIELENGKKGIVRDITWRNTTISTWQNNIIIIPNSKIADSIIENFFLSDRQILFSIPLGVSYSSDLSQVERVLLDIAETMKETVQECVQDFEPFVRFQRFGESSIDLSVFMKAKEFGGQFVIISLFIKAVQERFGKEGIEIPFPIRTVYMQQTVSKESTENNGRENSMQIKNKG
jgi:small-conductance mechanosensitive channel